MAQSLADLKTQLRDRLNELRPLVDEYRQLELAADALGIDGEPSPTASTSRPRTAAKAKAKAKARAPRGANKAAIIAVLVERPGATVSEIAEITGIAKPLIYNTTRAGITQGDMERVDLGGGRKGFKLAAVDADPPSDASTPTDSTPAADAESDPASDSTAGADAEATDGSPAAKSSPKRSRKRPGKRKSQAATVDRPDGTDASATTPADD